MQDKLIFTRFGKFIIASFFLFLASMAFPQENLEVTFEALNKIFCQKDFLEKYVNGVFTSGKEIYFKDVITFPGDFFVLLLFQMGLVEKYGICNKNPWESISWFVNGFAWFFIFSSIKNWIKS